MKSFREECALFGIWGHPEASRMAYLGLYALQHRGQESAGITAIQTSHPESQLLTHKGLGRVAEVFTEASLDSLAGNAAIGHNRYSTEGGNLLINAQPLHAQIPSGEISVAHNGNLVNATQLRRQLIEQGSIFQGSNDSECILHLLARQRNSNILSSLKDSLPLLQGAYSLVALTHQQLIGVRDPLGFRPLGLGVLQADFGTSYVLASETCAFDLIGAKFLREIEPGEIVFISDRGIESHKMATPNKKAQCIFEYVYFSRPDSVVFDRSVYDVRKNLGRRLAQENPLHADLVVPVPDSGVPAAIGYAQESGLPFEYGIIRNHYVGRTFIEPRNAIRNFGVKVKLNPQAALLNGKRVVVIDDSLVRGTTSKKIVGLIRSAGAKEVHLRIAAPPTVGPCYYGVDTPTRAELIAGNKNLSEIKSFVEADSIAYLSQEGLSAATAQSPLYSSKEVVGLGEIEKSFCKACFDNKYPTELFGREKG